MRSSTDAVARRLSAVSVPPVFERFASSSRFRVGAIGTLQRTSDGAVGATEWNEPSNRHGSEALLECSSATVYSKHCVQKRSSILNVHAALECISLGYNRRKFPSSGSNCRAGSVRIP